MRFYGEMRVQGGGPLDGARFDALAYALAGIEEADPGIEDVDLTSSLAQGWVTASMTITQENLELAVAKLITTVRTAIYPNGDHAGGWQFLTETAGLSVHPVADRAGMSPADQAAAPGTATAAPAAPGPPPGAGPPPLTGPPPALGKPVPSGAAAPPPLPSRLDARSRPDLEAQPDVPARPDLPARPDAPVSVWR
jgi:hypothetical protein